MHAGLSLKVDRGSVPRHCPLISPREDIHVHSERITQLKEAVKQLGLSAAHGVSAPVNKAPRSPWASYDGGDNSEQTSTPAAPRIQRDARPPASLPPPSLPPVHSRSAESLSPVEGVGGGQRVLVCTV